MIQKGHMNNIYLVPKRGTESYLGLLFKADITKRVDVYVDASFASDWNISWSENPTSVFSRTGYMKTYAGCPISWLAKLQTKIILSSTESE